MELAQVDQWAVGGSSAWHRASALGKLAATVLLIAAVVSANEWRVLLLVYAALLFAIWTARLPVFKIALVGAYPALFTLLFAVSQTGGWNVVILILARALTAALAMLLLITTTPYVDIFAALGRILPSLLADGLFLTYRSFFILLETFAQLVIGLRLRGAYSRWKLRGFSQMAEVVGMTFLRALDLAEHSQAVLHLRGYAGHIPASQRWRRMNINDALPLSLGALALALALGIRA
ncbi:MAG: energy-coupling factor transporter transmembrane protein EcfT [Chloroflexi bacterium]|nr:energy-coupling factor transporter transmembrane protein EcfT [Chloroflexota bacterium]MCL5950995.1 energy-coupling factor transporter transmembrane protein EcfT [Chloroflexota bacterium]